MKRVTFYIGLGKGGDIAGALDYTVLLYKGYTKSTVFGAWTDDNGNVVTEDVMQLVVITDLPKDNFIESAQKFKEMFSQDAVLYTIETVQSWLV